MGHRMGSVGFPFASIGVLALHRTLSGGAANLIVTGLILHAIGIFVWSGLFTLLARGLRWRAWWAAAVIVAVNFVFSWLVAWSTGAGLSSVLALGDRIVYAVVLAGALVVGMRFAFLPLGEQ